MKKLTLLIPTYKAIRHFEKHSTEWKEISMMANIIIIEDGLYTEDTSKDFALSINAHYLVKENGNWGSVINYAIKNRLIKSEYMAIVDADDILIPSDLEKVIAALKDKDVYVSDYVKSFLGTGKTKVRSMSKFINGDIHPFIHSLWFKTDLFYKLNPLPENISYTDNFLVQNLIYKMSTFEYISNTTPYIYYLGVEGQTMSGAKQITEAYKKSIKVFLEYEKWVEIPEKHFYKAKLSHENICHILANIKILEKKSPERKKAEDIYRRTYKMIGKLKFITKPPFLLSFKDGLQK